jgi:hypothetical protein
MSSTQKNQSHDDVNCCGAWIRKWHDSEVQPVHCGDRH